VKSAKAAALFVCMLSLLSLAATAEKNPNSNLRILIGRWGPNTLQDEQANQTLLATGADHAGTTVHETATALREQAGAAAPADGRDVAQAQALA